MDKFIVTIECTNPATLANIIKQSVDDAKIVNIESKHIPSATVQPRAEAKQPQVVQMPRKKVVVKQVDGWELYKFALELYHPQKVFKASNLQDQWRAWGRDCSDNAVSAHLHRLWNMALVKRVGGTSTTGYSYTMCRPVSRQDFDQRSSALSSNRNSGANNGR